jgi:membrane protein DedA with SNARE-associated domain
MMPAAIPSHLIEQYGYAALVMGAFVEGEAVLLLGGAAACLHLLALPGVILSGVAGVALADQLYFTLGRRGGAAALARRPAWEVRSARVLALLERHPALLIVAYRYLYGLRTVTLLLLGMSRVPLWRFVPLNLVSACLWAGAVAGAGYLSTRALGAVGIDLRPVGLAASGLVLALVAGRLLLRRR